MIKDQWLFHFVIWAGLATIIAGSILIGIYVG